MVSGEEKGEAFSAEEVGQMTLTIGNGTYDVMQAGKVLKKGAHTLNEKKSPKHIDGTDTAGTTVGINHGIYEITAAGHFRVCFAPVGKDRPTAFSTTAENGNFVHDWKRAAK